MPTLDSEIPPHEMPIVDSIDAEDPGNAVPGLGTSCDHDHGNEDYTCSPSDLGPMQKLFCKTHRHGFYGHCETHLLDELVRLLTPPPAPPPPPKPTLVGVEALVAEPSL